MVVFKPTLELLFKIDRTAESLVITPISWNRYAYTLAFFVLLGMIPSLLILQTTGNSNLSVALFAPLAIYSLY